MYFVVSQSPNFHFIFTFPHLVRNQSEFAGHVGDSLSTLSPLRLKDSSAVLPGDC